MKGGETGQDFRTCSRRNLPKVFALLFGVKNFFTRKSFFKSFSAASDLSVDILIRLRCYFRQGFPCKVFPDIMYSASHYAPVSKIVKQYQATKTYLHQFRAWLEYCRIVALKVARYVDLNNVRNMAGTATASFFLTRTKRIEALNWHTGLTRFNLSTSFD